MASIAPKMELIRAVDTLKINPLTRQAIGRGQHIYAYCNVRTNQVIYSLTKILSPNRSLRQLPEAGNNTKPPKLRKDLWRPLWTLTLPSGFEGQAQGLEAWHRLNALRYMHEIYWDPPKALARSRTEEEMEKLQEKLDERGGSYKETVYNYIKKQKKKMRLKGVMNQKSNSIADLAAVLVEQEAVSGDEPGLYDHIEVDKMMKLDQAAQGGALENMEARIERLSEQIKALVKAMPAEPLPGAPENLAQRKLRKEKRHELRVAQSRKEEMEHAVLMVHLASAEGVQAALAARAAQLEGERLEAERSEQQEEEMLESQSEKAQIVDEEKSVVDEQGDPDDPNVSKKPNMEEIRRNMWQHPSVEALRRIRTYRFNKKTKTLYPNPAVEIAKEGRAILQHPNEPNEDSTQLHAARMDTLAAIIQSRVDRLKEAGVEVETVKNKNGRTESRPHKPGNAELRRAANEVNVWEDLMNAYIVTNGTLRVVKNGRVVKLGADFATVDGKDKVMKIAEKHASNDEDANANAGAAVTEHEPGAIEPAANIPKLAAIAKSTANTLKPAANEPKITANESEPTANEPESTAIKSKPATKAPKPAMFIPKPTFSMEGIKVTWQNIMDAEFAPTWPIAVQHEPMGHTRHAPPQPGTEPRLSAQEYMEGKMRPRPVKEDEGAKVRKELVKDVSDAIIRRLVGKNRNRPMTETGAAPAVENVVLQESSEKGQPKEL